MIPKAIIQDVIFLKKVFWNDGKSPDNLTKADIIAKPKADIIINKTPLVLLLNVKFFIVPPRIFIQYIDYHKW